MKMVGGKIIEFNVTYATHVTLPPIQMDFMPSVIKQQSCLFAPQGCPSHPQGLGRGRKIHVLGRSDDGCHGASPDHRVKSGIGTSKPLQCHFESGIGSPKPLD